MMKQRTSQARSLKHTIKKGMFLFRANLTQKEHECPLPFSPLGYAPVLQHYNENLNRSLKLLPNLSNPQVYLNCYSKMTVKFAEPVLNETTAKILQTFGATTTKY